MAGLTVTMAVGVEFWRLHVANAISYDTVPVERGPIQASLTASGTLNAVVDMQVGSQVSGNIKALYADLNTKVKKGQLVAQIDPEICQTEVDSDRSRAGLRPPHDIWILWSGFRSPTVADALRGTGSAA